jgi:hypothetical protein
MRVLGSELSKEGKNAWDRISGSWMIKKAKRHRRLLQRTNLLC